MFRVSSAMTLLMAMFVVMAAAGCAGTQTSSSGPGISIPITDLKTIAGKWSGRASRLTSDVDDWLEVTLHGDDSFEAFSAKQIGVFQDKGTLTLSGGKVMAAGSHGTAVLTLYDRRGEVLVIDTTETNGVKHSADLRQCRSCTTGRAGNAPSMHDRNRGRDA
jgi:hypothetical protein